MFGSCVAACGGTLTDPNGVIKSPDHPATYPLNSSCQWLITAVPGRTIELSIDSFSLPSSNNCTGDRLRVSTLELRKQTSDIAFNWKKCWAFICCW